MVAENFIVTFAVSGVGYPMPQPADLGEITKSDPIWD